MNKKTTDFIAKKLKGPILSRLRKWVLETLMKKFLGRVIGGPWGWIAGFALDKIWKPYIKPAWDRLVRWGQKYFRKKELVKKGKKTAEAKDGDEWKDAVDDLFND